MSRSFQENLVRNKALLHSQKLAADQLASSSAHKLVNLKPASGLLEDGLMTAGTNGDNIYGNAGFFLDKS